MTNSSLLTCVQDGRVAQVAIQWPGAPGALTPGLLDELERLVSWVEDESPCDVLVFRMDPKAVSSLESLPAPPTLDSCRRWEKLVVRIDRLPAVSIALIDGACDRFWFQLALACDHRVAGMSASFQVLELKEGYLPGMNIFRLAKYAGVGRARWLVFTGAKIDARTAAGMGIVDQTCEAEQLDEAIRQLISGLQPIHIKTVQLARRLLGESFSTAFEDFLGQYLASQHHCLNAPQALRKPPQ